MDFSKMSRNDLINKCKELGIKKFSNKKKNELIKLIHNSKMDFSKMSRNDLINKCKELGIKKYSNKKKNELIQLIHNSNNSDSNSDSNSSSMINDNEKEQTENIVLFNSTSHDVIKSSIQLFHND